MKIINYSFIIPHKNRPDLLRRCIDSIPGRDDVQIIVVDDNSSADKKPDILRSGVEVILLDEEQSKGAGRARNVGLKYAKGKWLLFADADDYYNEGFLDVLDTYKETNYEVVFFNFEYRDGKTGEHLPPLKWGRIFQNYNGTKESRDLIRFHQKVPWTKMVQRAFVLQHNVYFEEVPNGNDILFSLMIGAFSNNFAVEKRPLYIYLRNDNSILTKKLSVDEAISKLIHRIKLNGFYNYIDHKEWKASVFKMILHYSWEVGLSFIITVIGRCKELYSYRNDWMSFFKGKIVKVDF